MPSPPKSTILLPLYIYPSAGKWDPLYEAIEAYPALQFIVIVNPNSGPGSEPWWPNADYVREIPRLNAYKNVKVVGYVATTYCKRNMRQVCVDVGKYAEWSKDARCPGLGVSGLFFDETPCNFSANVKEYLDAVSVNVKVTDGIQGDRLVIHNPGTAVERGLADPGPDITTVVETSYAQFQSEDSRKWLARSPYSRERSSFMIHSIPEDQVEGVVQMAREKAAFVFVTELEVDYYHIFGKSWKLFVAAMARDDNDV